MADPIPIGGIILCVVAAILCVTIVVLFVAGLNLPPDCCAPSEQGQIRIDIESELIQ